MSTTPTSTRKPGEIEFRGVPYSPKLISPEGFKAEIDQLSGQYLTVKGGLAYLPTNNENIEKDLTAYGAKKEAALNRLEVKNKEFNDLSKSLLESTSAKIVELESRIDHTSASQEQENVRLSLEGYKAMKATISSGMSSEQSALSAEISSINAEIEQIDAAIQQNEDQKKKNAEIERKSLENLAYFEEKIRFMKKCYRSARIHSARDEMVTSELIRRKVTESKTFQNSGLSPKKGEEVEEDRENDEVEDDVVNEPSNAQ